MGCGVSQDASVKALHSNIRWYDANEADADDRMERIKGMKNKEKTREQKIAERVAYMQQQQTNSDNLN